MHRHFSSLCQSHSAPTRSYPSSSNPSQLPSVFCFSILRPQFTSTSSPSMKASQSNQRAAVGCRSIKAHPLKDFQSKTAKRHSNKNPWCKTLEDGSLLFELITRRAKHSLHTHTCTYMETHVKHLHGDACAHTPLIHAHLDLRPSVRACDG
jgi:hypothetical protein